jgi:hypothetical protein
MYSYYCSIVADYQPGPESLSVRPVSPSVMGTILSSIASMTGNGVKPIVSNTKIMFSGVHRVIMPDLIYHFVVIEVEGMIGEVLIP